jgi:hypothetical protein
MPTSPDTPAAAAELWRTAHALADAARPATLRISAARALSADNKMQRAALTRSPWPTAPPKPRCARCWQRLRPQDAILGEERRQRRHQRPDLGDRPDRRHPRLPVRHADLGGAGGAGRCEGPVLGIIDQPYIGERFWGGLGEAWVRGPMGRARWAAPRGRWPRRSCFPPSPRSAPRRGAAFAACRRARAAGALRHGLLRLCAGGGGADRSGDRGRAARL